MTCPRVLFLGAVLLAACALRAEPVCVDGVCYPSAEAARAAGVFLPPAVSEKAAVAAAPRLAMGYMDVARFRAFLRDEPPPAGGLADRPWPIVVLLVLLGGLAANLTPCVLPLVPVNLAILLKDCRRHGWLRGLAYGAGITCAYGALGLAAAFGGLAFGRLQSSPWFSAGVACAFLLLALATLEKLRLPSLPRLFPRRRPGATRGLFGVFLLGTGAAAVAGACVEPILLATLLFTAEGFAAGRVWVVTLPFVLGAGMALPWPFAAAGLSVLPKPGAWMVWVKRAFALILLALAAWYAALAVRGFRPPPAAPTAVAPTNGAKPVLWKVGAPWCKNCTAMDRGTLRDPAIANELASFDVRTLEIRDFDELARHPVLGSLPIRGLPAYVILPPSNTEH